MKIDILSVFICVHRCLKSPLSRGFGLNVADVDTASEPVPQAYCPRTTFRARSNCGSDPSAGSVTMSGVMPTLSTGWVLGRK